MSDFIFDFEKAAGRRRRLYSLDQAGAIAELERDFGYAYEVPKGPRHDRIVLELGGGFHDGDLLVDTTPAHWGQNRVFLVNEHGQIVGQVE